MRSLPASGAAAQPASGRIRSPSATRSLPALKPMARGGNILDPLDQRRRNGAAAAFEGAEQEQGRFPCGLCLGFSLDGETAVDLARRRR